MHNARHIWITFRSQIYQQFLIRIRRLIFVSRSGHVFYTKALVLKLCSTKPQGSVGDFHGFHKHSSFITKPVNIILICFIGIFLFSFPIFGDTRRWVNFWSIASIIKLCFSQIWENILFSSTKVCFKKGMFGFYTQQGFRKNSDVVTRVPQILWGRIPLH